MNRRFLHRVLRGIVLISTLTCAPLTAFPQAESHAQAVAGLSHSDAAERAQAVVWLANQGSMADQPLLLGRLRDESPLVRRYAEQGLWLLWSRSGDAAIDRAMAQGVELMQAGQLQKAIAIFGEVIRRRPAFAESWNKRATAHYLAGDYQRSLADCDEVVKRNPNHFGALSGYGQIYFRLERYEKALEYWQRALEVNPNMTGVEQNIRATEQLLKEKRGRTT